MDNYDVSARPQLLSEQMYAVATANQATVLAAPSVAVEGWRSDVAVALLTEDDNGLNGIRVRYGLAASFEVAAPIPTRLRGGGLGALLAGLR